ncbi:MAG: type IV toxin-antitoxin system AbiEi family antitoxin [Pirellulaceae bacterium]|nr:type IV toxin-antitoxin system AbiEi family antitoxin [Pirellulaceae bacterium]
MVNSWREIEREAENAVRRIFDELGGFSVDAQHSRTLGEFKLDLVTQATSAQAKFQLAIDAKARITPQTVISVCERMRQLPTDFIPVVYAPVISPRVAEIVEQFGVGYVDQAGNCRLRSARHGLLIDRRGYKLPARPPKGVADPFSPKSSRIVRALLARPDEGHEKRLYLRDPSGLLENWAKKYAGPAEQIPMFFRGNAEAAEQAVASWCRDNHLQYALAGFSAAWRLAPEVRYSVGAVYVESSGFDRKMLDRLGAYQGGKRVDTGANLLLWRPFDPSALAGRRTENGTDAPVTSAIQTFLDLKRMAGRGEEAAAAVYERQLVGELRRAAERIKELRHADV